MDKAKGYLNIEVAYEKAVSEFAGLSPKVVAENSASAYRTEEGCIELYFITSPYRVYHPSGEVYDSSGDKVNLYLSTILLHYLNTADGTPLASKWVTFKELPGGSIYQEAFFGRAQKPFLANFGEQPEKFMEAAKALGGFKQDIAPYCMVIPVLPRVPVAFVLSPGDEEIGASCTILFDANAPSYLPTEDYAHLPGMVIKEMARQVKK